MRKNIFSLIVIALVTGLSSCSSKSSFESDVTKMANYRCKEQQLEAKDPTDGKAQKDLADLKKEMDEYKDKMAAKYKGKEKDEAMNKQADKIMDDVMAKCK